LGIETYASDTLGIGGRIRETVEDFAVEETLVDGSVARIKRTEYSNALRASAHRQLYLLCVLVKRNWDTFAAIAQIAGKLGISQTQVQIAGIKDARAVTAQHVTIEGATMEEMSEINVRDIEVRPVGYFRNELSPFYLLGNKFRIRIKSIKHVETTVQKRIEKTLENLERADGIPNFFGHQRFGTIRPITHLVGKAIVKKDFKQAVMLFLSQPSRREHPESRQARKELRSRQDFKQALRDFPRQLRYERLMLNHLAEKPNDFIGAFECLPVKLQRLFVQAYQSYLYNRFLSERLGRGFLLNVAEVGDFVVRLERSGLPIVSIGKIVGRETLTETNEFIKAGKIRIALPLVGTKQRLSQGGMGEIEQQVLDAEGVENVDFRVKSIPNLRQNGELRAIVSPIKDLRIQDISSADKDSRKHQVELEFALLRGSYATMLLREVMKPRDPIAAGF
jgi:tRNA pseudouridine13 synthase